MALPLSCDAFMILGDGQQCRIIDLKEFIKKKNGIKFYKFIIKPSNRMKMMYNFLDDMDENDFIVREFKYSDVIFLEQSPNRIRCLITMDVNNNDTSLSRRYDELTEALNDTERLLRSAEAAKNRLHEILRSERTQQLESMKQTIDLVKEVRKAAGRSEAEENMYGGSETTEE
jgi:hypothetical protein